MLRIGLIGTENSHTDHFVRHLNVDEGYEGCRVVALAGGDTEKNRKLAADGRIEQIVESAEDLLELVDAAVVSDRHGGLHAQNAVPLLEAGKHVFVDKPTAVTVSDTEAIIAAAQRGGAVLASWSAVRLSPGVTQLRDAAAQLGELQVVTVAGPADPDDPHAGLFFYGPHVVEPALELLGNPDIDDVHVDHVAHAVTVTARANGIQLVLIFVRPDDHGRVPWHISVTGRHGVVADDIGLGEDYNARSIARFLDAVKSGVPPMPYEQLLPPVRLLETVTTQL
ncbi:Gfo/Idh/MocA family protein [Phytoactinopolyspora endophytica]|uniref:Gfo/Idh/MocA family protein n=1 Tax=Phytoactinopolyspora endophytica TaxID=1642495 RepID=UPI00101CE6C7|nr:Gfo/Idh/MocA family oxidoreductase [Phytoactinopolyspora endophytica]